MLMCNDIDWPQGRKVMKTLKSVFRTLWKSRLTHIDSQRYIGLSSDQELKKSGMEGTRRSPKVRNKCFGSRILEKQERWKIIDHYNGDLSIAELLLRTNISVNYLSVFGAIANWCGDLAQWMSDHAISSTGKPVAQMNEQLDCETCCEAITRDSQIFQMT